MPSGTVSNALCGHCQCKVSVGQNHQEDEDEGSGCMYLFRAHEAATDDFFFSISSSYPMFAKETPTAFPSPARPAPSSAHGVMAGDRRLTNVYITKKRDSRPRHVLFRSVWIWHGDIAWSFVGSTHIIS